MKGTILYAEDEPSIRKCMAMQLGILEYDVITAENGRVAYEKFIEFQKSGKLNLILTDLRMPEMDGLTFGREVRKHYSSEQLPILGITGWAEPETKQQCIEAGFNGILFKPINMQDLEFAVDTAIAQNNAFQSNNSR